MFKQLFSEAPPGAMEKLLSPKRKFLYAMFALTPGTVLALFLQSVKNDMERENEALRLQHIEEELQVETERETKDVLLMDMIQDLRRRLQALEREVSEKNDALLQQAKDKELTSSSASSTASASASRAQTVATQAPTATAAWEKQKDAFLSSSAAVAAAATGGGSEAQSGINVRVKQRERDLLKEDVRAFKAARATRDTPPPTN